MTSVVLDFIRFQDKICGHCVIEYDIQNPEPAVIGRNYRNANLSPADYALYEVRKICFIVLRMPAKNNTNLAKTPLFPRFSANAPLKYVQYVCTRLYQKSSKISAFWLRASLTAYFLAKTRRANGLILNV